MLYWKLKSSNVEEHHVMSFCEKNYRINNYQNSHMCLPRYIGQLHIKIKHMIPKSIDILVTTPGTMTQKFVIL